MIQTTAVLLLSLTLFTCTDESNPYDVPEAAEIVWGDKTPAEGSSIPFFTGTAVNGKVLLPEHVKRVTITTSGNMAEGSDTLVFDAATRGWPTFTFRVSFPDTGSKMITATGLLSNGDSITADRRIYVHSPLNPPDIDTGIGARVELKTDPVGDDVTYVWDLYFADNVLPKKSSTNVVKYTIPSSAPDSGVLYVESSEHEQRSIGVSFMVTARDLTPPQISLIDAELSPSGEMVYLNRDRNTITFRVEDAEQSVADVRVNGTEASCLSGVCSYTPTFDATEVEERSITITAKDFAGNSSSKSFVVRYDPLQGSDPELRLMTKLDEQDRLSTTNRMVNIYGWVASAFGRKFGLKVLGESDTVIQISEEFDLTRSIAGDTVVFSLELYPDTTARGNWISRKQFTAIYSSVDETPPEIRGFYIGDTKIFDGHITPDSIMTLRVLVREDNSSVAGVDIESKAATHDGDGYYSAQVTLSHILEGNEVEVVARNEYNDTARGSITIKYNKPPEVVVKPAKTATIGETVTDTIVCSDPEGDDLAITIYREFSTPPDSVEVNRGPNDFLEWTPDAVGKYRYIVIANDGYEQLTVESPWRHVYEPRDTTEPVEPARFAMSWELEDTLTAALDSLSVVVRTEPAFQPARNGIVAELRTEQGELYKTLLIERDSLITWRPLDTDTGKYLLNLTVKTFEEVTDSYSHPIRVIPKPSVAFSQLSGEAPESIGTYEIGIKMSRPLSGPVPVAVTVQAGGSATRAVDYTLSDTLRTFSPGQTQLTIPVGITDDQTQEEDETIVFKLVPGLSDLVSYSREFHTLTIIDNDTGITAIEQPKVSFVTSGRRVREQDTVLGVEIALSKAAHEPVEVGIGVAGTAIASEDYHLSANRVRFEVGDTLAEIQITIVVDGVCEKASEDIRLMLENPSGAEFGSITDHQIQIDANEQHLCGKNALVISEGTGRYKNEYDKIDGRLIDTLESRGYVVTRVSGGDLMGNPESVLADNGVVFVSQSVSKPRVIELLKDVSKPVVCASGSEDYSVLGIAQNVGTSEKEFLVVHPNGTIRNELSTPQDVRILSGFQSVPWATPAASATVVATLKGEPDHAAIFLYESGATLADGTKAASARAGFPMIEIAGAAPEYEAEWWKLLVEVLDWAASENE